MVGILSINNFVESEKHDHTIINFFEYQKKLIKVLYDLDKVWLFTYRTQNQHNTQHSTVYTDSFDQ